MATLLNPVPIAIIILALIFIFGIVTDQTSQVFSWIKGAVIYGVLLSLGFIWAFNTVAGANIGYTSWNVLAFAVLQLGFMLLVSGGVQAGVVSARPDPPNAEELEQLAEIQENESE